MVKLLILFYTFFKIGLFSFGGGYAILPLIKKEVVDVNNWINIKQFTEIVAISQITPGPISINAATYVGYVVTGSGVGAIISTLGLMTPSVIIMYIFSKFFLKFKNNMYIHNTFIGLRVVVVGLILSSVILLLNNENFIDWKSYCIFLFTVLILLKWKINPIILTIISTIFGIMIY